ncbi:hypothetical protein M426DRAFT_316102 [Hypoxylon sp. CI-4A]|nr:hypothetical protein M426DRAFT_316102 [Hypoxylon sp. CI-4A]
MSAVSLRSFALRRIKIQSILPPSRGLTTSYHTRLANPTIYLGCRAPFSTSRTPTPIPSPKQDHEMSEPTGLIANSGIELLTFGTPNGFKVSILLEELKAAYGKEYTYQVINIMKNTQKEPWFTEICPNGRIPAIMDHDRGGFAVFEGLAILNYLTRHYDPEHKFSFPVDSDDYSVCEQWMAWQHGGLGPMQGQANHFYRFTKEKIPYGVQRYVGETERLYGVLDKRLADRDYVAGSGRGKYSIADINLLGWADFAIFSGIDLKLFPNVQKWLDRCQERPAVQKGYDIPNRGTFGNAALLKSREEDPEKQKEAEESLKFLNACKEKYGYKYASP